MARQRRAHDKKARRKKQAITEQLAAEREKNKRYRFLIGIYVNDIQIRQFNRTPYPSEIEHFKRGDVHGESAKTEARLRFNQRRKWDEEEKQKEVVFLRHQNMFLCRAFQEFKRSSADDAKPLSLVKSADAVVQLLAPELVQASNVN